MANDAKFGTFAHAAGRAFVEIDGKPTPLFCDPKLGYDDDAQNDAERIDTPTEARSPDPR